MTIRAWGMFSIIITQWACSASTAYEPSVTTSPCVLEPGEVRRVDLGDSFDMAHYSGYEVTSALVVDESTLLIVATGTEGANASWDSELIRFDLETGNLTQLTADEENIAILDARDGRVLISGQELSSIELDALRRVSLGEPSRMPSVDDSLASRPRRLIEGESSVWATEEGIMLHDGEGSRLIFESGESWLGWPMIEGGEVFWTSRESMTFELQVYRYASGEVTILDTTTTTLSSLFADDGRVIWGRSQGVSILNDGRISDIDVGSGSELGCADTFLSGTVAAFVCDRSIYTFDLESETLTHHAEPEELSVLGSPRLNSRGALVWLSLDDVCDGRGRLMFEHGGRRTEVADIRTDSYCVGHMAIPIELTMTDDYLIWSDFNGVSYCPLECG